MPENPAEAARWYRMAADQGNARAQNNIGQLYARGEGVPQNHAEAARWYRRAAEQGYADAQNNLGGLYYRGRGVSQDYAEAARWFRRAADQDVVDAQFSLGKMYNLGKGVPQNYAEAARWLRPAAEKGNAKAQGLLGAMYYDGTGIPQDDVQAYMWLTLAAAGETDPDLRDMVAQMRETAAARLLPAQRARAEEMARNWRPESQPGSQVASPRALTDEEVLGKSAAVEDVQAKLAALGYDPGPADGMMG